jgi:hypothetical protein
MADQLFIVKNGDNIHGFYIDLEKAQNKLKQLYTRSSDDNLIIKIYVLINGEYIITEMNYTYRCNNFIKGMNPFTCYSLS